MNISAPFIRRPVATSLLMIAIALAWARGMAAAAGGAAAAGRLPDHQRFRVTSRREPGDHGVGRRAAARAPIRSDRRRHADDLDQHARGDLDHAAIRAEPQHRRGGAGRAGGDHGGRTAIADRPSLAADLPQGQSRRFPHPGDGRAFRLAAAHRRRRLRRHHPCPADLADFRRGAGLDRRRAEALGAACRSTPPSSRPRG